MSGAFDSPRWCEKCKAYGDHHTDRCEVPTDEQMREWFPKLFALIDEDLAAIEAEEEGGAS